MLLTERGSSLQELGKNVVVFANKNQTRKSLLKSLLSMSRSTELFVHCKSPGAWYKQGLVTGQEDTG